jgi:hypothetical protein
MKKITIYLLSSLIFLLCSCSSSDTTQVAENTFVYKTKVYKIVDNELTIVGDLKSDSIRKFQVRKPIKREFGEYPITYIKAGASCKLNALYRGNILYFNLYIVGLNDLKDDYNPGVFTITFEDEFDFIIHSTEIPTNELTGQVGDDNQTVLAYRYSGKTEMSNDIYKAIKKYSVSSSVKLKSRNSYYGY